MNELATVTALAGSASLDRLGPLIIAMSILAAVFLLITCLLSKRSARDRLTRLAVGVSLIAIAGISSIIPNGADVKQCQVASADPQILSALRGSQIASIRESCRMAGVEVGEVRR